MATSLHVASYEYTMWTDHCQSELNVQPNEVLSKHPPTGSYYHTKDGFNGSDLKFPPSAAIIWGWGDRNGVGWGTLLMKIPCPKQRKFDIISNAKQNGMGGLVDHVTFDEALSAYDP